MRVSMTRYRMNVGNHLNGKNVNQRLSRYLNESNFDGGKGKFDYCDSILQFLPSDEDDQRANSLLLLLVFPGMFERESKKEPTDFESRLDDHWKVASHSSPETYSGLWTNRGKGV